MNSSLTIERSSDNYGPISLSVNVQGADQDPLILCVHGWPETHHSWRHQVAFFVEHGYRVAAMDVRGYGTSSRPKDIAAYSLAELAADAAAVLETLSPNKPAILFGHDWGAPIVHNTARLNPELVRAVAGMSVPYRPASPGDPLDLWRVVYQGKYFYMLYFEAPGVAEAEFEGDLKTAIRKTYFAASAEAPSGMWLNKTVDSTFLEGFVDPETMPSWMPESDLDASVAALAASGPDGETGLHGAFNRYRAQFLDEEIAEIGDPVLKQPACFIAGEADMVRDFVPGMDLFADPGEFMADYRGTTLIGGAGHWVNQEKPAETNAALLDFVQSL